LHGVQLERFQLAQLDYLLVLDSAEQPGGRLPCAGLVGVAESVGDLTPRLALDPQIQRREGAGTLARPRALSAECLLDKVA